MAKFPTSSMVLGTVAGTRGDVSHTLKEKGTPEGLKGDWPDLSSGRLAVGKIPPPR